MVESARVRILIEFREMSLLVLQTLEPLSLLAAFVAFVHKLILTAIGRISTLDGNSSNSNLKVTESVNNNNKNNGSKDPVHPSEERVRDL